MATACEMGDAARRNVVKRGTRTVEDMFEAVESAEQAGDAIFGRRNKQVLGWQLWLFY